MLGKGAKMLLYQFLQFLYYKFPAVYQFGYFLYNQHPFFEVLVMLAALVGFMLHIAATLGTFFLTLKAWDKYYLSKDPSSNGKI